MNRIDVPNWLLIPALLAFVFAGHEVTQAATLLAQVDDFETDTSGWGVASQGAVINADGGPGGAGDAYLTYSSNGGGQGGRMVIPNQGGRWDGDYTAEGLTGFELDALNDGTTPLNLRVGISNGSTWWVTTEPVLVSAGTGWNSVAFQIDADAMSAVGTDSFDTVASAVQEVRLLSSVELPDAPLGGLRGDRIVASIGIDNFLGVGVPEPAGLILIAVGIGLTAGSRSRTS